MPVEHRQVDSTAVVTISGRLVFGRETERLESLVKELSAPGPRQFVFDLSTLDYTDSSGVGAIVSCLTLIKKAGGELRVAGANPRIRRILGMTGVDKILPVYPTVDAAVAG
jgi:anti-sigma B factor antagonist